MKKNYNILDKILGIIIIGLIPGIFITLVLAGSNILSAGIPIILFGTIFVMLPLQEKDLKVEQTIFIILGFLMISIGISILSKSIAMFVYSFINSFGIMGLVLIIPLINSYLFNKKYCTKKVIATCSDINTKKAVFTLSNEDGTKGKKITKRCFKSQGIYCWKKI